MQKVGTIDFHVLGPVKAGARPRVRFHKAKGDKPGFAQTYMPPEHQTYEGILRTAAQQALGDREPLDGPLKLTMVVILPRPRSQSKREYERLGGWKTTRPDLDNYLKIVVDAINGVLCHDDAQIVRIDAAKHYASTPGGSGVWVRLGPTLPSWGSWRGSMWA
jgi:Holliday junction resolvase RusA-like endonuclease